MHITPEREREREMHAERGIEKDYEIKRTRKVGAKST